MDANFVAAGPLQAWHEAGAGALRAGLGDAGGPDEASLKLSLSRDGAVRLRVAAGPSLPPDPAEAVGRLPWRAARATPYDRDGRILLRYEGPEGQAFVSLERDPFALHVAERDGTPVATLSALGFAPDGRARIALDTPADERFHGFGEKTGPFEKRGQRMEMRNRDAHVRHDRDPLYLSVPFFLGMRPGAEGLRARGLLLDAFAPSRFDVAASDPARVWMETRDAGLDVTLFPGPRPADVLRRFTARVGRQPLPPRWALGHHQSRWSYRNARQVRRVAREIRRRGIPTDVIHLDIDHMDGYRVFTWHPRRFPDPASLLRELREQGFRVVTIVDPGVKVDPRFDVFMDGRARDVYCRNRDGSLFTLLVWPKDAALPDLNRPEVRDWWGEQHRPLVDAGVAGIWNDMNEPAGWARELRLGNVAIPIRDQDLSAVVQADPAEPELRVPHERVRNLYGQQHARATRAFLERAQPERRPFVLTRSGHAGIQRHAAVWTGDNASRWEHLRLSLPMLLNLSLSGVAFCGADIGGFAWSCTPELYARWVQIGALYPFARTHTMRFSRRQEPWRFGPRVEAIARAALELRMRLMPYLYGLFREAEESGAPVWRPLFWEFPDDPDALGVADQVMVGPALLAAPVLERGARSRRLHLPPGLWTSLHDGARYTGPRRLEVAAPLEVMPLFARGGSILPMQGVVRHAGETPGEALVLEVFAGGAGEWVLCEDDGETVAYRHGAVARTPLRLFDRAGGRLRIEVGARSGDHPVPPRTLRVAVRGAPTPRGVWLDARAIPERLEPPGWVARDGDVHVFVEDDGRAHAIELEPAP